MSRRGSTTAPSGDGALPSLLRNNTLAKEMKKLKLTGGDQAAPSETMTCDLCTGTRKESALMSCVVCQMSYCETHLQDHIQVPTLKKHKLVKATCGLEERICSHHDKQLEVFCTVDEHKGHDTVSATAEGTEKQSKLSQQDVQQRVQEREKEMKEIQQAVESLQRSGPAAEEDTEVIFIELLRSIDRRRTEVKELIRAQQRAAVSEAEGLVERLEQEIAELKKRDAELEQSYQSLSSHSVSSDPPSISVPHLQYFSQVTQTVSELREKLEDVIKGEWTKISFKVSTVNVFLSSEPKTRADFLPYACQLTLDLNTASTPLSLSEENRKVTHHQPQPYPDHPDRFTGYTQILCREGLSGRCYWEVEWSGQTVDIAVSYKDINRKDKTYFGGNNKSWMLRCSGYGYCFRHNKVENKVSGTLSSKIGVYLDHKAGTLAFYNVSDTLTLLHRVQTTFTQPLYPGFLPWNWDSSAEISKLW